jgi:Flp pilus assembly protein TadG
MTARSLLDRLYRRARDFCRADTGNVALTFAIAIVPIIGMVGAAVDYSRAAATRTAMQAAVDTTALMLSKIASTETDLQGKACEYFFALRAMEPQCPSDKITATYTTEGGSQVVVSATDVVNTDFMGVVGIKTIDIGVQSQVKWGNTRLRVALALDNTPSMNSAGKLDALKTATTNLITQLSKAATHDGDIYISIVPFSTDVNMGAGNYSQSWISWDAWNEVNGTCSNTSYTKKSTCEDVKNGRCSISGKTSQSSCGTCSISGNNSQSTCESDGQCSLSGKKNNTASGCRQNGGTWTTGRWTAGTWTRNTWTVKDPSKWGGCVQDRDNSPTAYNTMNTTPSGTTAKFEADPADNKYPGTSYCTSEVTKQTYAWSTLKDKIDNMSTSLYTNTTIGLVHAWQTLTDGAPYDPPAIDTTSEIKTQKIIIFLTDGENTQDRWNCDSTYPAACTGRTKDKTAIDDRMKAACANAKADNITIFTILVLEGNESLLQNCASPDDALPKGPKYFKLTAADQIVTTFQQIGTALSNLRIAQ